MLASFFNTKYFLCIMKIHQFGTKTNPMIRYLFSILFVVLFGSVGCKQETPRFTIPESIKIPEYGKINYISPRSLVDSLNRGAKIDLYYVNELIPENPDHIVMLPGMKMITFSDGYSLSISLSKATPVYLVSLYGNDSRMVAEMLAKDGINSYCLDGGSYQLYNEIQENGWKILPHPQLNTR